MLGTVPGYPPTPRTMPRTPEETTTKEVLYPDDLPGENLQIEEYAYYGCLDDETPGRCDDCEDCEELPDGAKYGLWLPVENGTGRQWAAAPRALREDLLELGLDSGDAFRVTQAEKGPHDHDEWHIDVQEVEEGDPL